MSDTAPTFAFPTFESDDVGARSLDESFLLDTRLGSSRGILSYADGVRHATGMLAKPNDRKTFVDIARILAFSEMASGNKRRIRPIGWNDLAKLQKV